MKQFYAILLFFWATLAAWAQTDSLDLKLQRGEITGEDWYILKLQAGEFSEDLSAWVQYDDQVDVNSKLFKSLKKKSGLVFHIPAYYQVIKTNGNRYIQAYLFNLTDSTLTLPRMDATLDGIESELYLNNNWIRVKQNSNSTCGNSYWTQKLEPNEYLSIQIENHDIALGKVKVRQKIKLKLGDQVLESREVKALLFPNQLKSLTEKLN
jgi:predicted Zn-dependent peptidase